MSRENKRHLLAAIMKEDGFSRVIVFTRTKHGANRLCKQLGPEGIQAEAIHANKSQGQRQRTMKAFREGKIQMLVATDLAARGIDVDDIELVVNFDLPNEPETYVHRIGRTARAGSEGLAISFCDIEERTLLRDIERFIGFRIPVETDHPYALDTEALPLDQGLGAKTGKKGKKDTSKVDSPARSRAGGGRGRGPSGSPSTANGSGGPATGEVLPKHDNRPAGERQAMNNRRRGNGDNSSRDEQGGRRDGNSARRPGRPQAKPAREQGPSASPKDPNRPQEPRREQQGRRGERKHYEDRAQNPRTAAKPSRQRPGRNEDSQSNIRLTARRGLEVEEFGVAALFAGRAPLSREAGPSRYDEKQPLTNEAPASNRNGVNGGNSGNGKRRQR